MSELQLEKFILACLGVGHMPIIRYTIGADGHKREQALGFGMTSPSGVVNFHKKCDGVGRFVAYLTHPDTKRATDFMRKA